MKTYHFWRQSRQSCLQCLWVTGQEDNCKKGLHSDVNTTTTETKHKLGTLFPGLGQFLITYSTKNREEGREFRCSGMKIEESEKAGSRWELNPGHLACTTSALPLSYDTGQVHTEDCAEHIEDCEGWWLSRCHSSVAEHWLHKPGILGSIPGGYQPFHFPLFSPDNI